MQELAPGQTLDQYALEDVIARSGMATIFAARDTANGHRVVLKVPHLEYASDLVFHERFRREEEIGRRLDHPAIIKVLGPAEKSRLYMAMEFVDGEILRHRLAREGRLPIADAVRLGIEIADALYYLHEHGVVHRDLKPENVMLLRDGGIKLIDFGIAHDATGRKMTWSRLSQSMGTPDYMAPEQVKGGGTDPRTDLYALGVILYEMLTGRVPFTSENAYAAMRAKVEDELVPPRKLRPEIPAALEEVVLQALARNPHDRPESALELREALAHPASVVFRDRTRRGRSNGWSPTRAGVLVWIAVAVTGYGVLLWALSRLR